MGYLVYKGEKGGSEYCTQGYMDKSNNMHARPLGTALLHTNIAQINRHCLTFEGGIL